MDEAPDRICTIAPETNTSGNRAAMALVATGSSSQPSPRAGENPQFRATCFGVGHGAGVCPTDPAYAGRCCCFCGNGGRRVSDYPHPGPGDERLRWGLGDQRPTAFYPRWPRERRADPPRKKKSSADDSRGGERHCQRCNKAGHRAGGCRASAPAVRSCYQCGTNGHISAECTAPEPAAGASQ